MFRIAAADTQMCFRMVVCEGGIQPACSADGGEGGGDGRPEHRGANSRGLAPFRPRSIDLFQSHTLREPASLECDGRGGCRELRRFNPDRRSGASTRRRATREGRGLGNFSQMTRTAHRDRSARRGFALAVVGTLIVGAVVVFAATAHSGGHSGTTALRQELAAFHVPAGASSDHLIVQQGQCAPDGSPYAPPAAERRFSFASDAQNALSTLRAEASGRKWSPATVATEENSTGAAFSKGPLDKRLNLTIHLVPAGDRVDVTMRVEGPAAC